MDIVSVLVNLLIICAIIGVVWWGLSQIPLPQPVRVIINIILAVVGILFLASLITGRYHGIAFN